MSTVKVLFFAADPLSSSPDGREAKLHLDENVRQIRETVDAAPHRDSFELVERWAVRTRDLVRELNKVHPHVVHFSGHGSSKGLVLVSPDGRGAQSVDAAGLAQLFGLFRDDIHLVVLSACFSRPQAEAIAAVVGCAIGTSGVISDEAAITFDATFYGAIAFGYSVQFAFDQACAHLHLDRINKKEHPQLIVRDGVDPRQLVLIPSPSAVAGKPDSSGPLPLASLPSSDTALPLNPAVEVAAPSAALLPSRSRLVPHRVGAAAAAFVLSAGFTIANPPEPRVAPEFTVSDVACATGSRAGDGQRPPGTGLPFAGAPTSHSPAEAATDVAEAKALYRVRKFADAALVFERAAKAGDPEAMGCIGYMYLYGKGVDGQPVVGLQWLRKAASDERDADAMYALAVAYLNGDSVERNEYHAREWFRKAVQEKGHSESMRSLGALDQQVSTDSSYRAALEWYRKAVDAGSVNAMVDLGAMYEHGLGTVPDTAAALYWYRSAAGAESTRGMVALGRVYQNGIGVRADPAAAMIWYRKAAEAGSANGMNNIGVLYAEGLGVRKSRRTAIRWFERAVDAGSSAAGVNLKALRD